MDDALCDAKMDVLRTEISKACLKQESFEKLVNERQRMGETALGLAREILNSRMIAENNIREELRRRTAEFITRNEFLANIKSVAEKAELLARETSKLDGRMISICFVIPFIVSGFMIFVFHLLK
jgi:hypothetical protein